MPSLSFETLHQKLRARSSLYGALGRAVRPAKRLSLPVVRGPGAGLKIAVGDSSLVQLTGGTEEKFAEVLMGSLSRGATFFDVGANVGWYALLAARAVGPEGRVVAFEPAPRNAALVRRNARRNGFSNVEIALAAVSNTDGWARFDDASSLQGRLSDGEGLHVMTCSLDRFVRETGIVPDVIKIDVQGVEADVLTGMRDLLARYSPTLLIELHGTNRDVARLLDEYEYRHRPVEVESATTDAPWWVHVLAEPVTVAGGEAGRRPSLQA